MNTTDTVPEEIVALVRGGIDQPLDDHRFNGLALRLFERQFKLNLPYRNFCLARDVSPSRVAHWREIPAIPTAAFKEAAMACFPTSDAVVVYESSGTTGAKRSRHYLRTLEYYQASLMSNFTAHLLPEGRSMPMLTLAQPSSVAPQSSLSHMLEEVAKRWSAPGGGCYLSGGGLDFEGLASDLRRLEKKGEAVLIMGTAFAFVHFLDECAENGQRFALASGSRLMDTGGYKGRSRAVPKDELYQLYEDILSISQDHIVNEYGMTEMGSQFYDNVLRDACRGRARRRHKIVPPWVRTIVVSPETMEPAAPGDVGLLRHFDLTNVDSVLAIQTDDLGVAIDDGFEILGRASGAEARGCSIAVDELLGAVDEPLGGRAVP